jgi:hypothetical protein
MGNRIGILKSVCSHHEQNVAIAEHELIISITTYLHNGQFMATTAPTIAQLLEILHSAPTERNKRYKVALILGMTLTHTQNPLPYDLILKFVMDMSLVDPLKYIVDIPIQCGQKKMSLDLMNSYEEHVRDQIVGTLKHAAPLQLIKHDTYNHKMYDVFYNECPFSVMATANSDEHPKRMKNDSYKAEILRITATAKKIVDTNDPDALMSEIPTEETASTNLFGMPPTTPQSEFKVLRDPSVGDRFIQCSLLAKELVNDIKGIQLYKLVTGIRYLNPTTFGCNVIISPPVDWDHLNVQSVNDDNDADYAKVDEMISVKNGKTVCVDVTTPSTPSSSSSDDKEKSTPLTTSPEDNKKKVDERILQPFRECQAYSIVCILNIRVLLCDWPTLRNLLPKPY